MHIETGTLTQYSARDPCKTRWIKDISVFRRCDKAVVYGGVAVCIVLDPLCCRPEAFAAVKSMKASSAGRHL